MSAMITGIAAQCPAGEHKAGYSWLEATRFRLVGARWVYNEIAQEPIWPMPGEKSWSYHKREIPWITTQPASFWSVCPVRGKALSDCYWRRNWRWILSTRIF